MARPLLMNMLAAVLAASAPLGAHAITRAIYIAPATMSVGPSGTYPTTGNIVAMYGDIDTTFGITFMLPPDYKANTPVKLRLLFGYAGAGACTMVLGASRVTRVRPGQAPYITDSPSVDGMTNDNVALVDLPANKVVTRVFQFSAPTKAPFADQSAGDAFTVGFLRNGANPLDTCDAATILWHAEVRYQATQ